MPAFHKDPENESVILSIFSISFEEVHDKLPPDVGTRKG